MSWYNRGPIYLCDPNKNTKCSKSSCQWACRMTAEKEYSVDGRLLTRKEIEKIQEEADAEYERRNSVILTFSEFQDLCPFHGINYVEDSHCEVESHCNKKNRQKPGTSWADCNAFVCPYTEWNKKPEEEK